MANLAFDCQVAINGTVPRLSALPYDDWSLFSFPDISIATDVEAIRTTPDCVVVWTPDRAEHDHPKFTPVWQAIREYYRPEAQVGLLEVWRRSPVPVQQPRAVPKLDFCPFCTAMRRGPGPKTRCPATPGVVSRRPPHDHGVRKPNPTTANALPS